MLQPLLSWAEFHDGEYMVVPGVSLCPSRAMSWLALEVQSLHVLPAIRVPSGFEPVRMS